MNYILFDGIEKFNLLPLTYTRPVSHIRIGILTIQEKWEKHLSSSFSNLCSIYLAQGFPVNYADENIFINGSICPNPALVALIETMKEGDVYAIGNEIVLAYLDKGRALNFTKSLDVLYKHAVQLNTECTQIRYPWDIFIKNDTELKADFDLLTKGRKSAAISTTNQFIGDSIFVEEGAVIEAATLNAKTGPIYIGKNAEIMEGSVIRGSFALCEGATLKMAAKIYGSTTIGPHCKIGGEVSNSIFFGYTNKAHDGFFGNSVIAEWCNIGADTNTSNLKNNYSSIKVWNYPKKGMIESGQQFCGLIMGDHAKTGINTMLNTGTVVGVSANVFGADFPSKFIPSFAWGDSKDLRTYEIYKAFETIEKVMERRGKTLSDNQKSILSFVHKEDHFYR